MQDWHSTAVAWSTIIIAFATAANLFVSILLWWATRGYTKVTSNIFAAANRPYVGIGSLAYVKTDAKKKFAMSLDIKNFGTVPAYDVTLEVKLLANDINIPGTMDIETKPHVIFPGLYSEQRIVIDDPKEYEAVADAMLKLFVSIGYKGVTEKRYSCNFEYARHPQKDFFEIVRGSAT